MVSERSLLLHHLLTSAFQTVSVFVSFKTETLSVTEYIYTSVWFFLRHFFDATSKIKEFVIRLNPSYLSDIISPKFLREDRSVWVSLMESIWAQKILIQYHDNYSIWRCWSSNLIGLLLLQKSRELTNIN